MKWGLRGRSIALCASLLLGTVAALSTALIWLNHRDSIRTMREHAVDETRSTAHTAEPGVLLDDRKALAHIVASALQDDNVCGTMITDAKGDVLAARCEGRCTQSGLYGPAQRGSGQELQRGGAYTDMTGSKLTTVVPIWPETRAIELELLEDENERPTPADAAIGYVTMIHTTERIRSEFVNGVLSVVVVSLVVISIGVAVTIIAMRQLLNPLRNLVETTRAIARGDRSKRAGEHAVGEIGELARSFNYMADRLQESYSSIEAIVEHRTAELVKANRAKDDFLANVSHEIRTPMTAITGFSESLPDPELSESERAAAVDAIRRNSDHLLKLINDILDISKIEAGKLQLERLRCSPCAIVEEIKSLMRVRAQSKDLSFKVEFLSQIPESIETDPTRLRQVLINLVGNAVKFTDRGGVQLRVRLLDAADSTETPSPQLRFDVIDTGIGLTRDQAENVFKPFTQADETMSRRFGGTGLGLTISQHLAHLLDGEITFESAPNKGSTFSVSIATGSLAGVPLVDPSPAARPDDASAGPTPRLNYRILLVEDGPDNQRLISLVLRKAGAEVVVAANGQVAVDKVMDAGGRQQPFDVILMDMQMPVLDGYAATRLLRQRGYRRPIIALTAHAMSTDREKCLTAGCDDYLPKPINRDKMLQLVERYAQEGENVSSVPVAEVSRVEEDEQHNSSTWIGPDPDRP
jgi:signal transduction histidine kinase/DNA-binding NarL/FixJ family response regulator